MSAHQSREHSVKSGAMGRLMVLASVLMGSVTTVGCNKGETRAFIDKVDVVFDRGRASLSFEFFPELSLQLSAFSQIEPYGYVQFAASTAERGFVINSDLHVDVFQDPRFQQSIVDTLPNGTPFPSYVNGRLGAYDFYWSPQWTGTLYVGVDPGKRLIGTSVNLSFVERQFPQDLNITQNIRDDRGTVIGVVTFFGPQINQVGRVVKPGGVFVLVNLNDLVSYGAPGAMTTVRHRVPIVMDGQLEIHNPNGADVSQEALFRLYEQTFAAGREAGLLK